jgi:hypothetical protein
MIPAGLYIHVPFCQTKCAYCSFYSLPGAEEEIPRFLEALRREMSFHRRSFRAFDTVYLGGGTPSTLTPGQIGRVLRDVRDFFRLRADAEVTVEMNPADWGATDLRDLRRAGVNRLNIGVQSLDDGVLSLLGRRHTAAQALRAIREAEQAGFANLGIDLMYSLPGQDLSAWLETLSAAVSLPVVHLSCYELTLEADTPLGRRLGPAFPDRRENPAPPNSSSPPPDSWPAGGSSTTRSRTSPGGLPMPAVTTRSTGATFPTSASVRRPIRTGETAAGGTSAPCRTTWKPSRREPPPSPLRRLSPATSWPWRPVSCP